MSSPLSTPLPSRPIERAQWDQLRGDLGDLVMCRYAASYLGLLSERLDQIEQAASAGQASEALRSMSDLRGSSDMLGAHRLAALVTTAETELRRGPSGGCRLDMAGLRAEAEVLYRALQKAIGELERAAPGRPAQSPPAPPSPPPKR